LKIDRIEHVAINVLDIEKSKDFYGRVLGFELLQSVDSGDCIIHYFSLPGGSRLELFENIGKAKNEPREDSNVGLRHLAFRVDDVAAAEKELRSLGVTITLPTCDLVHLGARVCLFLDPNGVTLEFCEAL
jgi:glyoxylase I family protein